MSLGLWGSLKPYSCVLAYLHVSAGGQAFVPSSVYLKWMRLSLCLCSTNTLRVFELVWVREGAHCHVIESVCWDVCGDKVQGARVREQLFRKRRGCAVSHPGLRESLCALCLCLSLQMPLLATVLIVQLWEGCAECGDLRANWAHTPPLLPDTPHHMPT